MNVKSPAAAPRAARLMAALILAMGACVCAPRVMGRAHAQGRPSMSEEQVVLLNAANRELAKERPDLGRARALLEQAMEDGERFDLLLLSYGRVLQKQDRCAEADAAFEEVATAPHEPSQSREDILSRLAAYTDQMPRLCSGRLLIECGAGVSSVSVGASALSCGSTVALRPGEHVLVYGAGGLERERAVSVRGFADQSVRLELPRVAPEAPEAGAPKPRDSPSARGEPGRLSLAASVEFSRSRGRLGRQAPCASSSDPSQLSEAERLDPRLVLDPARCSGGARSVVNREMAFEGRSATLEVGARARLGAGLELRARLPYVVGATTRLGYDDDGAANAVVDRRNSSVDPAVGDCANDGGRCVEREALQVFEPGMSAAQHISAFDQYQGYRYFALDPGREIRRSGLLEPSLGLGWSRTGGGAKPLFALGAHVDYAAPIVPIRRAQNDAVGRGAHELRLGARASADLGRFAPGIELGYAATRASSRSPISGSGEPPNRLRVELGSDVTSRATRAGARFGFGAWATLERASTGRDYGPMFDQLGASRCNGLRLADTLPEFDAGGSLVDPLAVSCHWIARQPSNAEGTPVYDLGAAVEDPAQSARRFSADGITTVEAFNTWGARLTAYAQGRRGVRVAFAARIERQQSHLVTGARARTQDGGRNPFHNPLLDAEGARFIVSSLVTLSSTIHATLSF